jgi:hypothetical protein
LRGSCGVIRKLKKGQLDYLEIMVEPYPYPISHKGKYYLRSGCTLQDFKGAILDRFILRKQGKTCDGVPIPNILQQMHLLKLATSTATQISPTRMKFIVIYSPMS